MNRMFLAWNKSETLQFHCKTDIVDCKTHKVLLVIILDLSNNKGILFLRAKSIKNIWEGTSFTQISLIYTYVGKMA